MEHINAASEMPKTRRLFEKGKQKHMGKNVDKWNRNKCNDKNIKNKKEKQLQAMYQQVQNSIVQLYSERTQAGELREGG